MTSFSQHPDSLFSLLHISDTHLLGEGRLLHGMLDTPARVEQLFERVIASGMDIAAVVFTGDLADRAEPDAYRRLRDLVEPQVAKLGAELVWVMGNHDERGPFREHLLGHAPSEEPYDRVVDVRGLRLIVLDSSVPGYHHGALSADQLDWLRQELSTPAERGTILALHHPPIPTPIDLMGLIELESQDRLWDVVRGSDVRGVLAGHLHYSTHTVWQGVPVSVASAMCYAIDLVAPSSRLLVSTDRGQTASLVTVYPEQLVFSELPAADMPELAGWGSEHRATIEALSPEQRKEMFSNKLSGFNIQTDLTQSGF